jgi:conjugal transfer pilus assembly protein TraV
LLAACGDAVDNIAGLGSSHYACPGMPNGVRCESTHSVYQEAITGALAQENAANALNPVDAKAALATAGMTSMAGKNDRKSCPACGDNAAAVGASSSTDSVLPQRQPPEPTLIYASDGALPLRTPASVMRIWVNAWQDKDGDLHMPGPIFTEIAPRRWQIGVSDVGAATGIHVLGDPGRSLLETTPTTNQQQLSTQTEAPPLVAGRGAGVVSSFEPQE